MPFDQEKPTAAQPSFSDRVRVWAADRNLIGGSTPQDQLHKLAEEVDELNDAITAEDHGEIVDAIGDIQVVLAVMCAQLGIHIDDCREVAWDQIKDRTGKMVNGVFVKDV